MTQPIDEKIPAGFWPRAAAWLLDRALLFLALLTVRIPALVSALSGGGLWWKQILFTHTFRDVLCWALCAAYFVLLTYFTGATLGKKAMKLRVVDAGGGKLTLWNTIYRETIGRYLSSILCIGYIMAAADPEKRALHDMLCNTRVVYAPPMPRRPETPAAPRELSLVQTDDPQRDWYKPYRV